MSKKYRLLAGFVIFIIAALLLGSLFFKDSVRSTLFLAEFIHGNPVKPLQLFTPDPVVKEISYPSSSGETIQADLWLPKEEGSFPAVILHLGVDIDRRDTRAQTIAQALSRSGIAALVPNISSLHKRRVLTASKDDLVASFQALRREENINQNRVGFFTFCASAGLTAVAAAEPEIAEQVSFLILVNPYYDLANIYTAITTKKISENGEQKSWQPHFKTVEIYNRETIGLLADDRERELLGQKLVRISQDTLEKGDYQELLAEEKENLSSEALFTYDLLTNTDPQKSSDYVKKATGKQSKFLQELSPRYYLDKIKARIFVIVDRENVFIPFTQSLLMQQDLGERATVFETKLLPSGEINQKLPIISYPSEFAKAIQIGSTILKEISQ